MDSDAEEVIILGCFQSPWIKKMVVAIILLIFRHRVSAQQFSGDGKCYIELFMTH